MNTTVTLRIDLDPLTAYLLDTAADLRGLTSGELAAHIVLRDMAARTGWPGKDGFSMQTALRDFLNRADADELQP